MRQFREVSKRANRILKITSVLAVTNFVISWCVDVYFGGDALNGYVKNGHFFICSHGNCHEVTSQIWHFSYWYSIGAFAGVIAFIGVVGYFIRSGDIVLDFSKRL